MAKNSYPKQVKATALGEGPLESAQTDNGETEDEKLFQRYKSFVKVAFDSAKTNFHDKADRFVKLYSLIHYEGKGNEDRIKVPYPFSNARQILSEIYVQNPDPIVKPRKAPYPKPDGSLDKSTGLPVMVDTVASAEKLKNVIKYVIDHIDAKQESTRACLDFIVTGLGGTILTPKKGSKFPQIERLSYKNILPNPEATYFYQSDIIARKVVYSVDELQELGKEKDSKWVNLDQVRPNVVNDYTKSLPEDDDVQKVLCWDVYDREENVHMVFPDQASFYILKEEFPLDFKDEVRGIERDWPICLILGNTVPDSVWPIGDIAPIESTSKEYDKIRTMQVNHIKRFNRKYWARKGTLTEKGKRDLTSAIDGTIVEATEAPTPIIDAPLSSDIYQVDARIDKDMQLFGGTGPNFLNNGVNSPGQQPNTLGEAQIVENATNAVQDKRRDAIADYFRRLYRMTGQFVMENWTEEDVFLITGDGSKETDWLHYSPEEVKGEYDYDVDASTFADNTKQDEKQLISIMNIATPILSLPQPPQPLVMMLRKLLELEGWKDIDEILPEPSEASSVPGATSPGAPGASGLDPELEQMVQSLPPDQFANYLQSLPPGQQQVIIVELQKAGMPVPGGSPATPLA